MQSVKKIIAVSAAAGIIFSGCFYDGDVKEEGEKVNGEVLFRGFKIFKDISLSPAECTVTIQNSAADSDDIIGILFGLSEKEEGGVKLYDFYILCIRCIRSRPMCCLLRFEKTPESVFAGAFLPLDKGIMYWSGYDRLFVDIGGLYIADDSTITLKISVYWRLADLQKERYEYGVQIHAADGTLLDCPGNIRRLTAVECAHPGRLGFYTNAVNRRTRTDRNSSFRLYVQ